jgi:hypothetical protein
MDPEGRPAVPTCKGKEKVPVEGTTSLNYRIHRLSVPEIALEPFSHE